MPLPTEKQKPRLSIENLKAVWYGPPKIGKTSTIAQLNPDHTLFIATEPGHDGIEAFVQPCRSWEEFREIGAELSKGEHPFKLVVVDTVDELQRMCAEHVVGELGRRAGRNPETEYLHASDFEYGKGWEAVTTEFKLRVAKLASLGLGVVFVSHVKESTKKDRVGREIDVVSPDVGQKGSRTWLLGFVDYIFLQTSEQRDSGDVRLLRTQPAETHEAGSRGVLLPDPIELGGSPASGAKAVRKALIAASKTLSGDEQPAEEKAA